MLRPCVTRAGQLASLCLSSSAAHQPNKASPYKQRYSQMDGTEDYVCTYTYRQFLLKLFSNKSVPFIF